MRLSNLKPAALVAASLFAAMATPTRAINAVFVAGSSPLGSNANSLIEVQGFNGRFDIPMQIQGPPATSANSGDSPSGVAATDSVLYSLLNSPSGTSSASVIAESDPHTGAYLGSIQLPGRFSDIAYTNGQLYGIQSIGSPGQQQSIQIYSIAANGTLTPILNQTVNSFTQSNWILSGAVTGDSLLFSAASSTTSPQIFVPSTPSIPPSKFTTAVISTPISATIIHADGAGATIADGAFSQTEYSYPTGTLIGPRASNTFYGASRPSQPISDEFSYTYASSQPAYAAIQSSFNALIGSHDGLYRTPQTISTTVTASLQNGVAPDGTTLSNFVANNLFQQTFGAPLPITIQETDATPGPFSARQIAQANISINTAGIAHGVYTIGTNSNLSADYTTGSSTQTGRPVVAAQTGTGEFAYDPASANLVGNGNDSLQGFGWETVDSNTNVVEHSFAWNSSLGLGLFPSDNDTESMSQILTLPTSNSPMELSFSYADTAFDPANLIVSLNGIQLANFAATSSTTNTFQTTITNPSLFNLTNATLTFQATPTGTTGASFVALGNITLQAVPEPTSFLTLVTTTALLGLRRKRQPNSLRLS